MPRPFAAAVAAPPALALALAACPLLAACSSLIQGTRIKDTSENRAILGVIDVYVRASEALDPDGVMSVVSTDFFEDGGTPDPADDYGYDQLRERLQANFERLETLRIEVDLTRVQVDGDRATAQYTYKVQFQYKMPWDERKWDTREDVDQIVLVRADDESPWLIVSGM
jgi:hypothetical protein